MTSETQQAIQARHWIGSLETQQGNTLLSQERCADLLVMAEHYDALVKAQAECVAKHGRKGRAGRKATGDRAMTGTERSRKSRAAKKRTMKERRSNRRKQ